jgi:hypothetical protein
LGGYQSGDVFDVLPQVTQDQSLPSIPGCPLSGQIYTFTPILRRRAIHRQQILLWTTLVDVSAASGILLPTVHMEYGQKSMARESENHVPAQGSTSDIQQPFECRKLLDKEDHHHVVHSVGLDDLSSLYSYSIS